MRSSEGGGSAGGRYTFGDGDVAAERLGVVASVFEPASRPLVAAAVPPGADVVVDLGCGPGHTTRLLARVCRPRVVLGLDMSDRFVARARLLSAAEPGVAFAVHDVTAVPFPAPARAPDAVYARFLLSHLPEPLAVVERWRSTLRPGGALVLDELEDIATPPGVFTDYEDLVTALVAAEGADMYAGRALAPLGGEVVHLDVDATAAARMFGMNLATWGPDAVRRGLVDDAGVERLAAGLAAVTGGAVPWALRQIVLPARPAPAEVD